MEQFTVDTYKGETLKGWWKVSFKIDGVRLHVVNGEYKSRN